MTRSLKVAFLTLLAAIIAIAASQTLTPKRADALTPRPALVSARSAALASDRGLVQLRAVGAPSRDAFAVIRQSIDRNGVRPTPSMDKAIEDACQKLADGSFLTSIPLVGGMAGSVLSTTCTIIAKAVVWIVEKVAELAAWAVHKIFMPVVEWAMIQAMGFALGVPLDKCYDDKGVLLPNASTNAACNGSGASARVLKVVQGNTWRTIVTLSFIMALPLLLAAVIQALIKQSLGDLGKTLLRLPFVWILAVIAVYILAVAVAFRDGLVTWIIGQANVIPNIHAFFAKGNGMSMGDLGATIMQILAALFALIGSLMLAIIFMIADIIVLVSVLFLPLATVGLIWGGTAKWFKRLGELSFGFIIGKVIVVGILALALEIIAT